MAPDSNSQHRRPHFHRGRRGQDRRGGDRRTPQQAQAQEHGNRDHVDVDQIMREIRTRIAQRHGIELTNQQIQELAARRLEAILDPRLIKPTLLEQLRRSAGAPPEPEPAADAPAGYTFEDTTLYESHRGPLRFIRRLLNPILKLFFNPTPLIQALHTQAQMNTEMARRELAHDRRQSEWNALHYEILQRLVTEISRVSLENQSLSMRVESLAAKVEFNERRVRGMEQTSYQTRSFQRPTETAPAVVAGPTQAQTDAPPAEQPSGPEAPAASEGGRRRRRRRRGRRSGGLTEHAAQAATMVTASTEADSFDAEDVGDEDDLDGAVTMEGEEVSPAASLLDVPPADVVSSAPVEAEPASVSEPAMVEQPRSVEQSVAAEQPGPVEAPAPAEPLTTAGQTPPRDEPSPVAPVEPPDPGPPDR